MYVEIDFNLLYQLEKIAQRTGQSVTDLVNEAVTQYLDRANRDRRVPGGEPRRGLADAPGATLGV